MISYAKLVKSLAFALVFSLLPALSLPTANATGCTQYKIGFQGPLTGPDASLGIAQLSGVTLALQKFLLANPSVTNISNSVKQIDDQGDLEIAATAVTTALQDSCLLGVVGPSYSGTARMSLPLYEEKGIPVITPSAVRGDLSDYGSTVFNRQAVLESELNVQMIFSLLDSQGSAKVAYFYNKVSASKEFLTLKPRNLTVYAYPIDNESEFAIYESKLIEYKAAGATKVVLDSYLFSSNIVSAVQKAKAQGFEVILGPNVASTSTVEGLLPNSNLENVKIFTGNYRFKDLGSSLSSSNSSDWAPLTFDAAYFMLSGIKGGAISAGQLATYLRTNTFTGINGEIAFDSRGEKLPTVFPEFLVSNGAIVASNSSAAKINGNLTAASRVSSVDNFKFKVATWDDQDTDYQAIIYGSNLNYLLLSEAGVPKSLKLANGTYTIEVYPLSDPQGVREQRQSYEITVTSNAVTSVKNVSVTPNIVVSKTGDTFSLKLATKNTRFTLNTTEDVYEGVLLITATNVGVKAVMYQKSVDLSLDPSKVYQFTYYPPAEAWKTAPTSFISNVTLSGAVPYQVTMTPELANIHAGVDPMPNSGGMAYLLKDDGTGTNNFVSAGTRSISSSGKVGFKADPGTKIKIRFVPNDNQLGEITTPEYTVPATGILTVPSVAFTGQNVNGTISLAGGGVMEYGYYEIVKTSVTPNSYVFDGSLSATGQFAVRLPVGTYRIYVNGNNPEFKSLDFECVVTDVSVTKTCNATADKKPVIGSLTINSNESTNGYQINAWNTVLKEGFQAGSNVSNTGRFGLELSAGSYTLVANKYVYEYANDVEKEYNYDKGYVHGCNYQSSPLTCNVNLVNNFTYSISDSANNSLADKAVASFKYRANSSETIESLKNQTHLMQRYQLNNTESVSLPDGEHLIAVEKGIYPSSSKISNKSHYLVSVSGGSVTSVRNVDTDTLITPTNGVYDLKLRAPNFVARILEGSTPVNNSQVSVTYLSNNNTDYLNTGVGNSTVELQLTSGSYQLEIDTYSPSATRTAARYVVTMASNGTITMTKLGDSTLIAPEGGAYPLRFSTPNLIGKLTTAGTSRGGHITWRKFMENGNYWNWHGWQKLGPNGEIYANFLPGKYRAQVSVYDPGSKISRTLIGPECVVPESGTVTCDIAVPNVSIAATISADSTILKSDVYASVSIDEGEKSKFEVCCTSPNSSTGKFEFALLDGKYQLKFWRDKDGGNDTRTYKVEIKNQIVTSFVDAITNAPISAVNGVYGLTFLPANLSGTIKNSQGTAIDFSQSGASISLEKWIDEKYWGGVKGSWISNSNYEMRVDSAGKYRLYVSPQNVDTYSGTYSSEFYVNANGEVSTSASSGFAATLINFHVVLNSNNVLLKVLNPIDDKPLSEGYIYFYKNNLDGSKEYKSGVGVWASRNGLVGQYLEPGSYDLALNVWGSSELFGRTFTIDITDTSTVVIKADGVPVEKDGSRFVIKPYTTNVKGRIYDSVGNVYGSVGKQYVHVNVQKYFTDSARWDWVGYGAGVDADGYFGLRIKEAGKFRLVIEPQGNSTVAQTFSSEFEILQSEVQAYSKDFGSIKLNAPNVKIAVVNGETGTALANVYIQMYKFSSDPKGGKNYVKGLNSDSTGIASGFINEEGRYEFEVFPPWDNSIEGATRKSYMATVTKDANNNYVTTFDAVSGVSVVSGVTRLQLGGSNLRGVVYRDDGTTPIANSQVMPYKVTADGEIAMWEYAIWSSGTGKWSMNLPAGTYKLKAQAPYDAVDQASSSRTGVITIGANGAVTSYPAGKDPLNFGISLKVPNWRGVLKAPTGDELIKNASICLNYRVSGGYGRGECFRTDSEGRFGFSIPDDALFDSETTLNFYDPSGKYPELRLNGKTEIETKLGVSGTGITVRMPAANIVVTVTGGGQPQKGVWLNVSRPGVEWIGGKQTDDLGVAGVYSSNITDAFEVNIWVPTEASAINQNYVSTIKYYTASDVAANKVNGVFQSTVALPVPNIKGAIRTPVVGSAASELAVGAYINVLDSEKGEWVPGVSVSKDGTFAMFLRGGCCTSKTYQLFVDPGYDKDGKRQGFVRKEYTVEVSTSNVATIKDKRSGAVVGTETMQGVQLNTIYLGTPNLTGVVVNPSNQAVANSEVYAWGNCQDWWGCYQYSDQNGQFGLSLADGDFTLGARTPWGNSEFADSDRCVVTVSGNTVTNKTGNCIQSDGKAKISLRDPNFTFTLKDGSNPLRNAYVYLSIGGWGTQARTDENGKVSILVNDDAIAANSQGYGTNTFAPYISVWMWGNEGDVIPWHCKAGDNKPICDQLTNYTIGTPFGTKALGNIQGATYNTRIKVTSPDNTKTIRNYAYVEVVRFDEGYDNWFGWGETNSEGWARFYLETSSALANAKFKVRVVPPYEHRNSLVEKVWDNSGAGYTLAELNNLQLALGTPNLKLAVTTAVSGTPNRWGWYSLEVWDSQTVTYKHVSGNGLDYGGLSALNLLASKQYRLVAYPGGGRSGSATTCIINTDSQTVITLDANLCIGGTLSAGTLNLQLARGNVIGKVFAPDGTTPIVGAIVYANRVDAVNEDTAVITCTLSDGSYGMTLDPNYQWQIKIFPANKATGPQYANKSDTPAISPQQNQTLTVNITLALK